MRQNRKYKQERVSTMKLNKKGFTIVELVIVIAVIAILAAVLIPTFNSVIQKANESSALQTAKAAESIVILEENGSVNDAVYYYVVFDKAVSDDGAKPKYAFIYDAKNPSTIFSNVSETVITDGALTGRLNGGFTSATDNKAFLSYAAANGKGKNADLGNNILVFKITTVSGDKDANKNGDYFNFYNANKDGGSWDTAKVPAVKQE